MFRPVKRELGGGTRVEEPSDSHGDRDRRILRSRYLAVKSKISEKREDIANSDPDKFSSIMNEVESLHQLVQKPREQVADAEALLDITNTLVSSVKAHGASGITPSNFVSFLCKEYGQQGNTIDGSMSLTFWKDVGVAVSHVFKRAPGCYTMIGPMDIEPKIRKTSIRRKHDKPTQRSRPEEIDDSAAEEKTDTDKNMAIMFNILRKNRISGLENLILNRTSFAQTVENLFALSFLVKDGRAEIKVDEKGHHLVSPKNAPAADEIASRKVSYSHFVFRFDFRDWKVMLDYVESGEELMPHRGEMQSSQSNNSQRSETSDKCQPKLPTTPIRKFSRNRGLVMQEQTVPRESPENEPTFVEDSPEEHQESQRSAAIRKGKRKMRCDGKKRRL